MLVLTNLKGLYVKASYGTQEDGQARLSGVKLDSAEEIEDQKKRAKQKKLPYTYNRKCRELSESDAPKDVKPVVRFKSKIEGSSIHGATYHQHNCLAILAGI